MMNNKFGHLTLPMLCTGKPKLHGGGKEAIQTAKNKANYVEHGKYLKDRSAELSRFWKERRNDRSKYDLPEIKVGIPLLLEIDQGTDVNFLHGLGFEIICEIEEGFIIVATEDIDLSTLNDKLDHFIKKDERSGSPAKIYALCEDEDRIKRILSYSLYEKWAKICPETIYVVDIGVSCCGLREMPIRPQRNDGETDEHYDKRFNQWQEKSIDVYSEWDSIKREREQSIEQFISNYGGIVLDYIDEHGVADDLSDSFSARLKISGSCLKDMIFNLPYIFECTEAENITLETSFDNFGSNSSMSFDIKAPENSDPIVCVIDSGIQEEHQYLAPAIVSNESYSMLPNDESIGDEVSGGGHGTRVAGAILYPNGAPSEGEYQLPCRIRNMRVLNKNNRLPKEIFPPNIIFNAVQNFNVNSFAPTKIFNQSIGESKSCEMNHMSAWAAEIDNQSYKNDVLFVQAAGNISTDIISVYWNNGWHYPEYLDKELCRISNPAQSLQALTVGSVSETDFESDDYISLGKYMDPSSFSRSGPGIWDVLKPEVVEFGGTHAINKDSNPPQFTTPSEVCPELIRKSPEGPAFARDDIGTSFSTPKVTYIASQIEKILPDSPALLYRALIVQSARWPEINGSYPDKEKCTSMLRHIGYGVPNVERATHNDEYRVSLITPSLMELGDGEAHIYKVPIPEELSAVGEDYDILVEVTLSYAASPRRTRRGFKGYLSTWLDWSCSRIGESAETFSKRILETGSVIEDDGDFKWILGDATNHGVANGYSRKNSTLQKDWCIIKSNQLNDAFCIAVRGHKGWGAAFKAKYSLVVSFEAINHDIPIYEMIQNEIELLIENNEIELKMSGNPNE